MAVIARRWGQPALALVLFVASFAASAAQPNPAAAVSCSITEYTRPYRVAGPAVQGYGKLQCTSAVYYMGLEIEIWMLGGSCSPACRVAYKWVKCEASNCTTVGGYGTTGVCAGTRQYTAKYKASWKTSASGTYGYDNRSTATYTLSC